MSHESIQPVQSHADALQRRFLPLLTQNQRRIFAYIYTLVPHRADAEDLLQETCITLWEKFEEFEPGTDFAAWACRVAYWKVLNARRKYARSPIIHDDSLLAEISDLALSAQGRLDRRHEALTECLGKLSERDRRLVLSRYQPDIRIHQIAEQLGRSVQATYKAISRIRLLLLNCVSSRLKEAGA